MSWLLDGNVIVALLIDNHPHYQRATTWFSTLVDPVVTCAVKREPISAFTCRWPQIAALEQLGSPSRTFRPILSTVSLMMASAMRMSQRQAFKATNKSRMPGWPSLHAATASDLPRWMPDLWRLILMLGS